LIVGNGKGGNQVLFLNGGTRFKPMRRPDVLPRDQTAVLAWRDHNTVKLLAGLSNYEDGRTNAAAAGEFDLEAPGRDQSLPDFADTTGPLALGSLRGEMVLFAGGRCRPMHYPQPASSRIFKRLTEAGGSILGFRPLCRTQVW